MARVVDLLNRIANGTMKVLLRSPLHGLVSGRTMLITVTGRRTGRRYTTPVNYAGDGHVLTVFSRPERKWWRNLRDGAPVTVRLRGRELQGFGEVVAADPASIAAALMAARPRMRPERAARRARDRVMVRVRLSEDAH